MTTERLPQVGETWKHKTDRGFTTIEIKAIDGDTCWVLTLQGLHYSWPTKEIVKYYNPPKQPLRQYTRDYPIYFVMDRHLLGFTQEENARGSSESSNGKYPVLRIDGVDEDGKVIGEQIL